MMKFFKKSDVLVVLAILFVGIISLVIYKNIFSNKPAKAEIYYESELVKTVDLHAGADKIFSIPQNEHVIFHIFKDGSIRFEESDCPDKICVKTGRLKSIGETAACLPNKTILKIVPLKNHNKDDLDMIAQ